MTEGLNLFAEEFKDYINEYVIIGGTATSLLLEDKGLSLMRTTKDIDIVILVENLSQDFGNTFWKFIKKGGYKVYEKYDGTPQFFRFSKPKYNDYPFMLELFARKQNNFKIDYNTTIIPIHLSDELSSLSAILLNDEYYKLLTTGKIVLNGVSLLSAVHLIPFKAKAYLDLSTKKDAGKKINSTDIMKHQNDIFRLSQLLTGKEKISISETICRDMQEFLNAMEIKDIKLKNIEVLGDKNEIIKVLKKLYVINNKDI